MRTNSVIWLTRALRKADAARSNGRSGLAPTRRCH
jgi:hypothetical protein